MTYLIVAFGTLLIFSILNLDLVFIVWGLPILGFIAALTASPLLLFMLVFKRRHFPCETVDELVDQIISVNWTDLITDDKKLFKDIVQQENEFGDRASAQQSCLSNYEVLVGYSNSFLKLVYQTVDSSGKSGLIFRYKLELPFIGPPLPTPKPLN